MGRPVRLHRIRIGQAFRFSTRDVNSPELAGRAMALGSQEVTRREDDMLAIWRPGWVVAEIRKTRYRFAGGAHQKDTATVAV
jgi:hypothetical protein